jgi:AcrR family transcriptional regulator
MKSKKFYYTSKISEVFLQHGISGLTVEMIAEKIGVTKKTLYNYFESKQEMIESFLDYLSLRQKKEISKLITRGLNPIELMVQVTKSIYNSSLFYHRKLENDISPRYQESLQNIIFKRRYEMLEFIAFNLNKGINMGYLESDLDVDLASKFFLFGIENLFLSHYRFTPLIKGEKDIDHVLYYQLKGMCTSQGLVHLRRSVNFKINLLQEA